MRKKTKKGTFSKAIVLSIVVLNAIFTTAVLYAFIKVGSEPVALIGAWFAFTTGELWILSGIKKKKTEQPTIEQEDHL
jgi:hypothetical protein